MMPSHGTVLQLIASVAAILVSQAFGQAKPPVEPGRASVFLNEPVGTSARRAAGLLYGIPDQQDQIPLRLFGDLGINYVRAGGAHISGGKGWVADPKDYQLRFLSAMSNYEFARKINARFVLLLNDLWGTDGDQSKNTRLPGEGRSWLVRGEWDSFLNQVIFDLQRWGMTEGLEVDIWNGPDSQAFWNGDKTRYFEMWTRSVFRIRENLPRVQINGPALYGLPAKTNTWWTDFLNYVAQANSAPDCYVLNILSTQWDVETAVSGLQSMLYERKMALKPMQIARYGDETDQTSSGTAWWIGQLERHNVTGVRANWRTWAEQHDFLASLLSRPRERSAGDSPTGDYHANGEYQVLKYYNQMSKGMVVRTTRSSEKDKALEVFATVDSQGLRLLTGSRQTAAGTIWVVEVNGVEALGLPREGTVRVRSLTFPFTGPNGRVDGPVDRGWVLFRYSSGQLQIPVIHSDKTTAYAYEIARTQ